MLRAFTEFATDTLQKYHDILHVNPAVAQVPIIVSHFFMTVCARNWTLNVWLFCPAAQANRNETVDLSICVSNFSKGKYKADQIIKLIGYCARNDQAQSGSCNKVRLHSEKMKEIVSKSWHALCEAQFPLIVGWPT